MHVLTVENTNLRKEITKIPPFLSQDSSIPTLNVTVGCPAVAGSVRGHVWLAELCAS